MEEGYPWIPQLQLVMFPQYSNLQALSDCNRKGGIKIIIKIQWMHFVRFAIRIKLFHLHVDKCSVRKGGKNGK